MGTTPVHPAGLLDQGVLVTGLFTAAEYLALGETEQRTELVEGRGTCITARDVLLVVEVASSGSRRTDHVGKRGEYAAAGIPHYRIVDDGPTCFRAGRTVPATSTTGP